MRARWVFAVVVPLALSGSVAEAGRFGSPADVAIEKGERKLQAGDDEGALAAFAEAQREAPRDPRPRYLRGAALAHQKKFQLAAAAYREALAIDPKLPEVHNELGTALEELKQFDEAIREYATAASQKPEASESWFNQGRLLRDEKHDLPAAIKVLTEGCKAVPHDVDLRVELSTSLRVAKRLPESLTTAREAVAMARSNADAHLNLGLTLQALHQLDEAAAVLTTATRLQPKLSGAWWALGEVERERKRLPGAIAALTRAEQLNPGPGVSINLAAALRDGGDLPAAEKVLRAATLRTPRSLALRFELVRTFAAESKCPAAKDALAELPKDHGEVQALRQEISARCR